eukprot:gene24535-31952_t
MSSSSVPPPKPPKSLKKSSSVDSVEENQSNNASGDVADGSNDETVQTEYILKGSKNVAELLKLDAEDESLRKYKEALLGGAAHGDLGNVDDPRTLVVEEFRIVFAPEDLVNGVPQPDIVHFLGSQSGLDKLSSEGITMIEGSKFKFIISFRVQHEIIAGIKFINCVNTRLLGTDKEELMIGSYPPSSVPHKRPRACCCETKHLAFDYELNIVKR